jgi:hypothetical protein
MWWWWSWYSRWSDNWWYVCYNGARIVWWWCWWHYKWGSCQSRWTNWMCYWSWWWWYWWCWYHWVAIIYYPKACNYNIIWWDIACCNWFKIHTFTTNWTLCVN